MRTKRKKSRKKNIKETKKKQGKEKEGKEVDSIRRSLTKIRVMNSKLLTKHDRNNAYRWRRIIFDETRRSNWLPKAVQVGSSGARTG